MADAILAKRNWKSAT